MRLFKSTLAALLLCLLIPCVSFAEGSAALTPMEMTPEADGQTLDLYCGPTQGFYRHAEQTLDTGKPYVFFGQYDCWAMVAQGSADSFGPVGWIEAALIADLPDEPLLGFEDGFAAMVEETAQLTDNPRASDPFDGWTASLEPGTQLVVLAPYGDWLYVQSELEGAPLRAFIPASAIE